MSPLPFLRYCQNIKSLDRWLYLKWNIQFESQRLFISGKSEAAERLETWGGDHLPLSHTHTLTKMLFALFVGTSKPLRNLHSFLCVRNRFLTMRW